MENITVSNSDEFFELIKDFKTLFLSNVETLQEIAQDEEQPFIKRKIIGMMTSDDENMALKSIQWLHELVTSASNVELKLSSGETDINTGTFVLTKKQKAIYNKLKKGAEGNLIGDDSLYQLLAINTDHYNEVKKVLEYTGFKREYKTGAQQIRPEVTVLRDCSKNIQDLTEKLGLTMMSRYKVGITPKPKAKATLTSILRSKAE